MRRCLRAMAAAALPLALLGRLAAAYAGANANFSPSVPQLDAGLSTFSLAAGDGTAYTMRFTIIIMGDLGEWGDDKAGRQKAVDTATGWIFDAITRCIFDDDHWDQMPTQSCKRDTSGLDIEPSFEAWQIEPWVKSDKLPGREDKRSPFHRTVFEYKLAFKSQDEVVKAMATRLCNDGLKEFEASVLRALDLAKLYPFSAMKAISAADIEKVDPPELNAVIVTSVGAYTANDKGDLVLRTDLGGCKNELPKNGDPGGFFFAPECPKNSYFCDDVNVQGTCDEEEAARKWFCKCKKGFSGGFQGEALPTGEFNWTSTDKKECRDKTEGYCDPLAVPAGAEEIVAEDDSPSKGTLDEKVKAKCAEGFEAMDPAECKPDAAQNGKKGKWTGTPRCQYVPPRFPDTPICKSPVGQGIELGPRENGALSPASKCSDCWPARDDQPSDCNCEVTCQENYVDADQRPTPKKECVISDFKCKAERYLSWDAATQVCTEKDTKAQTKKFCCHQAWQQGKAMKPAVTLEGRVCATLTKIQDCVQYEDEATKKPCCWNEEKKSCSAFGAEGFKDKKMCAVKLVVPMIEWKDMPSCKKVCPVPFAKNVVVESCGDCKPGEACNCKVNCADGYEHLGGGKQGPRECLVIDGKETFGAMPICGKTRKDEVPECENLVTNGASTNNCQGIVADRSCDIKCKSGFGTVTGRAAPGKYDCQKKEAVLEPVATCSALHDKGACLTSAEGGEKSCCWRQDKFGATDFQCLAMGSAEIGIEDSNRPDGLSTNLENVIKGCAPAYVGEWSKEEVPVCKPTCSKSKLVGEGVAAVGCDNCIAGDRSCVCRVFCDKIQGFDWYGGHSEGNYVCKEVGKDGEGNPTAEFDDPPICKKSGPGERSNPTDTGDDDQDDHLVDCGRAPTPLGDKCVDSASTDPADREVAPACCYRGEDCGKTPTLSDGTCIDRGDGDRALNQVCCAGPIYNGGCGLATPKGDKCVDAASNDKEVPNLCCKDTCGKSPKRSAITGKCQDEGNGQAELADVCCERGSHCGKPVPKDNTCVDHDTKAVLPSRCCKDACGAMPVHVNGECRDIRNGNKKLVEVCCAGGHPHGGEDDKPDPGSVDCGPTPAAVMNRCVDLASGREVAPACCYGGESEGVCGKSPVTKNGKCVDAASGDKALADVCCKGDVYNGGCGTPSKSGEKCVDTSAGNKEVSKACCEEGQDCGTPAARGGKCVNTAGGDAEVPASCCKGVCGKFPTSVNGKCIDKGDDNKVLDATCCAGGHPSGGGDVPGSVSCGEKPSKADDGRCLDNTGREVAAACCFDGSEDCGKKAALQASGSCVDEGNNNAPLAEVCCKGIIYNSGCGTPKPEGGKCINLADNNAVVPKICCKDECGKDPQGGPGSCKDAGNGNAALDDLCCEKGAHCGTPKPKGDTCVDSSKGDALLPSDCCADVCGVLPTQVGDKCLDKGNNNNVLEKVCCAGGSPTGGTIGGDPSPSPSPSPSPTPGPSVIGCGVMPTPNGDKCVDNASPGKTEVPPACCFNGAGDQCGKEPLLRDGRCLDAGDGDRALEMVCCHGDIYNGGCGTPAPKGDKCVNTASNDKEVPLLCCKDVCGLEPGEVNGQCVDKIRDNKVLPPVCCKEGASCGSPEARDGKCVDTARADAELPQRCCKDVCGQMPSHKGGVCVDLANGDLALPAVCCQGGHPSGGTGDDTGGGGGGGGIIGGVDCGTQPEPADAPEDFKCVDKAAGNKEVAPACCFEGNEDTCGKAPATFGGVCRDADGDFKAVPEVCCKDKIYGQCGVPAIVEDVCKNTKNGLEVPKLCCEGLCGAAKDEGGVCKLGGETKPAWCCKQGDTPPYSCGTPKPQGETCVDEATGTVVRSACCKDVCGKQPGQLNGKCIDKADPKKKELQPVCCGGGHPSGGSSGGGGGADDAACGTNPQPKPKPDDHVCWDSAGEREVAPACCFGDRDDCGRKPVLSNGACVDSLNGNNPLARVCCQGPIYDGGCGTPEARDATCVDKDSGKEVPKLCCQNVCGVQPKLNDAKACVDAGDGNKALALVCCDGEDGSHGASCGVPKLVNNECVDSADMNSPLPSACCMGQCGALPRFVNGLCVDKLGDYRPLPSSCCGGSDPTGGGGGGSGGDGGADPGPSPKCNRDDIDGDGTRFLEVPEACSKCEAGKVCLGCDVKCKSGFRNVLEAPFMKPSAVKAGAKQCLIKKIEEFPHGKSEGKLCTQYTEEQECLSAVEELGPCCWNADGITKEHKCVVRGSADMIRAPASCTAEFEGVWEKMPVCKPLCDMAGTKLTAGDGTKETGPANSCKECVAGQPCACDFACDEGFRRIGGGPENEKRGCEDPTGKPTDQWATLLKVKEAPLCQPLIDEWVSSTSTCPKLPNEESLVMKKIVNDAETDWQTCKADGAPCGYESTCADGWSAFSGDASMKSLCKEVDLVADSTLTEVEDCSALTDQSCSLSYEKKEGVVVPCCYRSTGFDRENGELTCAAMFDARIPRSRAPSTCARVKKAQWQPFPKCAEKCRNSLKGGKSLIVAPECDQCYRQTSYKGETLPECQCNIQCEENFWAPSEPVQGTWARKCDAASGQFPLAPICESLADEPKAKTCDIPEEWGMEVVNLADCSCTNSQAEDCNCKVRCKEDYKQIKPKDEPDLLDLNQPLKCVRGAMDCGNNPQIKADGVTGKKTCRDSSDRRVGMGCCNPDAEYEDSKYLARWERLPTCKRICEDIFTPQGKFEVTGCQDCVAGADPNEGPPCCTVGECLPGQTFYGGDVLKIRQCVDIAWTCHHFTPENGHTNDWCQTQERETYGKGIFVDGVQYRYVGGPDFEKNKLCGTCWCCTRSQEPAFVPSRPPICGDNYLDEQVDTCDPPKGDGLVIVDGTTCSDCPVGYTGNIKDESKCNCKVKCDKGWTPAKETSVPEEGKNLTCRGKGKSTETELGVDFISRCDWAVRDKSRCLRSYTREPDNTPLPCCWLAGTSECWKLGDAQISEFPEQCTRIWKAVYEPPPTCKRSCQVTFDQAPLTLTGSCDACYHENCDCKAECKPELEFVGGSPQGPLTCTEASAGAVPTFSKPPICLAKPAVESCKVSSLNLDANNLMTTKACQECAATGEQCAACGEFKCKPGYVPVTGSPAEGARACRAVDPPVGTSTCKGRSSESSCLKTRGSNGARCCYQDYGMWAGQYLCRDIGDPDFKYNNNYRYGDPKCGPISLPEWEEMPQCERAADTATIPAEDKDPVDMTGDCDNCKKGEICTTCTVKCKAGKERYGGRQEGNPFVEQDGTWRLPLCHAKEGPPKCPLLATSNHLDFAAAPGMAPYRNLMEVSRSCGSCFAGDATCCIYGCAPGYEPPNGEGTQKYSPCVEDAQPRTLKSVTCSQITDEDECLQAAEQGNNGKPCCWRSDGHRADGSLKCLEKGSEQMQRRPDTNFWSKQPYDLKCAATKTATYRDPLACEGTCKNTIQSLPGLDPVKASKSCSNCGVEVHTTTGELEVYETAGLHSERDIVLQSVKGQCPTGMFDYQQATCCIKSNCCWDRCLSDKSSYAVRDSMLVGDAAGGEVVWDTDKNFYVAVKKVPKAKIPAGVEVVVDHGKLLEDYPDCLSTGQTTWLAPDGCQDANGKYVKWSCCNERSPGVLAGGYVKWVLVRRNSLDVAHTHDWGWAKTYFVNQKVTPTLDSTEHTCKCEAKCKPGFVVSKTSSDDQLLYCGLDGEKNALDFYPGAPECERLCEKPQSLEGSLEITGCTECRAGGTECFCNVRCGRDHIRIGGGEEGSHTCATDGTFNNLPNCQPECDAPGDQNGALDTRSCVSSCAVGAKCDCSLRCNTGFSQSGGGTAGTFTCNKVRHVIKQGEPDEETVVSAVWQNSKGEGVPVCIPVFVLTVVNAKDNLPVDGAKVTFYSDPLLENSITTLTTADTGRGPGKVEFAGELMVLYLKVSADKFTTATRTYYRAEMCSASAGICSAKISILPGELGGTDLKVDDENGCHIEAESAGKFIFNAVLEWNDKVMDLDLYVRSFDCGVDSEMRYNCGFGKATVGLNGWSYDTGCRRDDVFDFMREREAARKGFTRENMGQFPSARFSEERACRSWGNLAPEETVGDEYSKMDADGGPNWAGYSKTYYINQFPKWVSAWNKKLDLLNSRLAGSSPFRDFDDVDYGMCDVRPIPELEQNIFSARGVPADYPPGAQGNLNPVTSRASWSGRLDSPSITLDVDQTRGYGPETITFKNVPPGRYQIVVNRYSPGTYFAASVNDAEPEVRLMIGTVSFLCKNKFPRCNSKQMMWSVANLVIEEEEQVTKVGGKKFIHKVKILDRRKDMEPLNRLSMPTYPIADVADQGYIADRCKHDAGFWDECVWEHRYDGAGMGDWAGMNNRKSWIGDDLLEKNCHGLCEPEGVGPEFRECLERDYITPGGSADGGWIFQAQRSLFSSGRSYLESPDMFRVLLKPHDRTNPNSFSVIINSQQGHVFTLEFFPKTGKLTRTSNNKYRTETNADIPWPRVLGSSDVSMPKTVEVALTTDESSSKQWAICIINCDYWYTRTIHVWIQGQKINDLTWSYRGLNARIFVNEVRVTSVTSAKMEQWRETDDADNSNKQNCVTRCTPQECMVDGEVVCWTMNGKTNNANECHSRHIQGDRSVCWHQGEVGVGMKCCGVP